MLSGLQHYQQLREQFLELFPEIIDLSDSIALSQRTELLKQWQTKTQEDKFLIMVVGDFSRGKSTLINALLGKDLLPRRMTPCTGAITLIQHGDPPMAIKTYWKEDGRPPEKISFDQFQKEVSLAEADFPNIGKQDDAFETSRLETAVNPQLARNPIRQLDLYYPAELCRNRVQIVDSPGLNEDIRQTETTLEFLPQADAVIVVMTAERALAENEVRFIRNLLAMGFQHLFFVINFRDDFEEDEEDELLEMEDDIRKRLNSILNGKRLRLVTLSSRLALEGRMEGNAKKLEESHITDLEDILGNFLCHQRGQAFLTNVTDLLRTSCKEIDSILCQRTDLRKQSIEELEKRQHAIESRNNVLQERKRKIIETVHAHSEQARRRLLAAFRDRMARLADSELPQAAESWLCDQKVLLTLGHYKKCTAYYVRQADTFIQEKITEWANQDAVPLIQQEVERLCEAIGDDARSILMVLDEMRMEINADAQFGDLSTEKPDAMVMRLMTVSVSGATGLVLAFVHPVAAIIAIMTGVMGGLFGTKQFAIQVCAGIVMAFSAIFLPVSSLFWLAAGGFIAVVSGFKKNQSSKDVIRKKVINDIQIRVRQPTGEMEERLGDTVHEMFNNFSEGISSGIDTQLNEIRSMIETVVNEKRQTEQETLQRIETEKQLLARTEILAERIDNLSLDVRKLSKAHT